MVTRSIIKKIPFSYQTLQKIKANEYQRFFNKLEDHDLYINHLGEVQWMTAEEAIGQHEFFIHEGSGGNLLNRFFYTQKTPNPSKLTRQEWEIRLQFRILLEKTYLGEVTPKTQQRIPDNWQYELKEEELLHIPITVDSLKSRDWKKPALAVSILLIIAVTLIPLFILRSGEKTGQMIVHSNVEGARVFMDNQSFLGYTESVIQNMPVGAHRVSIKKDGFMSIPEYQEIRITGDSLRAVDFKLKPYDSEVEGNLKVVAEYKDSDLFINNEYYGKIGDFPLLTLEEGQYNIEVSKAGYITVPDEQMVNIIAGDTTIVILDQVSSRTRSKSPNNRMELAGTLDITSNISDAQIYLNGKNTGKATDYVFTNLRLGQYTIRLVKDGFISEPEEKTLRLTSSNPTGEASFHLRSEYEDVQIETDQSNAKIYVDGNIKGTGTLNAQLSLGKHNISFGDIPGYNAPTPREIDVKPRLPINIEVKYFPQMRIIAEVTDNGNVQAKNCNIIVGYTFANKGFSPSDEAGPEVIYDEKSGKYFWKLGYAFALRNPKGNDAIQVAFKLPHELDYKQEFTLTINAATSEDKYPLSLSRTVDISIKFNNHILSYYYQPKSLKAAGGMETAEWDITPQIKPGLNLLEIATTEKNNTFYFVKRIEIYN